MAAVPLLAQKDLSAPSRDAGVVSNLELRIEPGPPSTGLFDAFTLVLTNLTTHAVHLPQPLLQCGSLSTGTLYLRSRFVPATPLSDPETYTGCFADASDSPILLRVATWDLLMPDRSMRLPFTREQLPFNGDAPGTYEIWADYVPPYLSPAESEALTLRGIDYPRQPLTTAHVLFQRGKQKR